MTNQSSQPPEMPERPHWKEAFVHNLWAVIMVAVVMAASFFIVRTFKPKGQATVLESLQMGPMSPMPGAVPVAISGARYEPIEGSIAYTGTVVSYEDEDIYPRITGRIVDMPVYPGDKVRKGQLLVRLDPAKDSEYWARYQEAKYAATAAAHVSEVTKEDLQKAQFELKDAKAQLDYWEAEIKRQEALLKKDVVSQQEFDDELAKYKSAKARTNAAQAALDAAVHHVGHEFAAYKKAESLEKVEEIIDSYTRIVAGKPGVVTKRIISPGVVVEPGMKILNLAHIDKVRLQAEVATEDLYKVHLGTSVYVRTEGNTGEEFEARITSIFPAADPRSRTSIVEALVFNHDVPRGERSSRKRLQQPRVNGKIKQVTSAGEYLFLPGQYVVMTISTGSAARALAVPSKAIIWREGRPRVWKADGGKVKTVSLVDVKLGLANADKTEITEGLNEGDSVVYAGYAELEPGEKVIATEWGPTGPSKLPMAEDAAEDRLQKSNSWTITRMAGHVMIDVSIKPAPPQSNKNNIEVKTYRHGGGAISGMEVDASTSMPTMDMKGPSVSSKTGGDGIAKLKTDLHSGLWKIDLDVKGTGDKAQKLSVQVEVE